MLAEPDILDALRACYDTHNRYGQPVNIVDLGLVEAIKLTVDPDAPGAGIPGVPERFQLSLTLVPSTPEEDAQTQLSAQIANRLAGLQELSHTAIHFADEPAWTPARISPQGRALLKLDAAFFPILNNPLTYTPPMPSAKSSVVSMPTKTTPRHPFDIRYGTDTSGLIPHEGLLTGHAHDRYITAYYGIAPSILDSIVELWMNTPPLYEVDRYTFLDVGSGKGRAMLQASLHPFHQVTGIELNPVLAAITRENMRAFAESPQANQLAPVSLIEGDALAAPLPDTPTVAFLFHPFEAPVLRRFLDRCQQHFAQRPGALDILYVNAEHAAVLDRNPGFTRLFNGLVPMSPADHAADLIEIAEQKEYGSTGDEFCTIFRFTGAES